MATQPSSKMKKAHRDRDIQEAHPDRAMELEQDELTEPVNDRKRIMDELSERLSTDYKWTNKSFPWFFMPLGMGQKRLSVDRYYPTLKVAIDFKNGDLAEVHFKKTLLKENGIRYANMVEGMQWDGLIRDLSEQ